MNRIYMSAEWENSPVLELSKTKIGEKEAKWDFCKFIITNLSDSIFLCEQIKFTIPIEWICINHSSNDHFTLKQDGEEVRVDVGIFQQIILPEASIEFVIKIDIPLTFKGPPLPDNFQINGMSLTPSEKELTLEQTSENLATSEECWVELVKTLGE